MPNRTYGYDGSLEGLFLLLHRALAEGEAPDRVERRVASGRGEGNGGGNGDLFADRLGGEGPAAVGGKGAEGLGTETVTAAAFRSERELADFSWIARLDFIYAWMSELPIEREILAFAHRVILAGRAAAAAGAERRDVGLAAEAARTDRGDAAVRATLVAAQKVEREVHRLMGLLRFSEEGDRLVARCACDHWTLPALAQHFSDRFGSRPWAIIDERRRVVLLRDPPDAPRFGGTEEFSWAADRSYVDATDEWEDLWRDYHRAVTIDSRKNPALQRRLMPVRYWKYLKELQ